jgi:hypothetical protein
LSIIAWAHCERDAPMVERNERFGFPIHDGKEVSAPPQAMAFAFDELARSFTGLAPEFRLLLANPGQPRDRVARATSKWVPTGATRVTRPLGG